MERTIIIEIGGPTLKSSEDRVIVGHDNLVQLVGAKYTWGHFSTQNWLARHR